MLVNLARDLSQLSHRVSPIGDGNRVEVGYFSSAPSGLARQLVLKLRHTVSFVRSHLFCQKGADVLSVAAIKGFLVHHLGDIQEPSKWILSTPLLGLRQVEEGKIWFSPNHQIAYRFGYPDEPIKLYKPKSRCSFGQRCSCSEASQVRFLFR